jgi:AcrR family transcriptional regulator
MARSKGTADLALASRDALATRDRILTEAERLFRVYGYSKTTVADIAEATRMSPANVYRFFASKSDINNAICERILDAEEAALQGIARLPLPAADRLRRLILELHQRHLENYMHNNKVHEMVHVAMEERWEAIGEHIRTVRELVAAVVADGIAKGEFRTQDAKRAAACVSAAMAPLCHPLLLEQRIGDPQLATADEIVEFIIRALS